MSTTSYPSFDKRKIGGGGAAKRRAKTPSMFLLETCVSPSTGNTLKWRSEFVPRATQLLLANRPSYIIVRNTWNPVPFEHYPSKPATCTITTREGTSFVWTDPKVWSAREIEVTCEDCDFISGNMWFYIPDGVPRSPDELFENVVDPLLEWSRAPSGCGEAIGSAEEALGLMYWNAPAGMVEMGAHELRRLAHRIGIVIENEDAMIIDCLEEEFGPGAFEDNYEEAGGDADADVPRGIPFRDWFWLGIALIILHVLYLMWRFEFFGSWSSSS